MLEARGYQNEAINLFKNNNYRGIFEMATGTGKTITSLLCSKEYFKKNKKIFLIVIVPFNHLVTQWVENIDLFYETKTLNCRGSQKNWIYKLDSKIRDFNNGFSNLEIIVSTYKTASSEYFNKLVSKIKKNTFLIADECHYFGMKSLKNHSLDNIDGRLGLSATPDRWWDEKGSRVIKNYFKETIYEYDMVLAIKNGTLTPYDYHYFQIPLEEDEIKKYSKLTKTLISYLAQEKKDYEKIKKIILQRIKIINRAKNKITTLIETLRVKKLKEEIKNTLVYCAIGTIDEVTKEIANLGIKVHKFDSTLSLEERENILKRFELGDIELITAMKCLDEGVDIPSTQTAYFLASTSNPKEFIQRRGRVLRKSKYKNKAIIYDFITMVPSDNYSLFKSILGKEMPRFAEFSRFASNKYEVRNKISKILKTQELEYMLDKLPWDIYYEQIENMGEINDN